MSDPVTNVDVEDVLSSIRRLVSDTRSDEKSKESSESHAVEAETTQPDHEVQAESKPADALILTSALRVNSEETDSQPDAGPADMTNFRHRISGEARLLDAENAVESTDDHADWPSMASDDYYEDDVPAESSPVIDFVRHGRKVEPAADPEVEPEMEWADEEFQSPGSTEASAETDSEEQHQEVAEAASEDVHDWVDEPEGDAEPALETSEDHHAAEMQAPTAPSEDADAASDAEAEDDSLKEEAIFAAAAAASVVDAPQDGAEEPEVNLADFDESVIDEDALRELVADIVREELTGDLGEKITRNVRKLVRREIHRAMLTREFE